MKKIIAALCMAAMLVGSALAAGSPSAAGGVEIIDGYLAVKENDNNDAKTALADAVKANVGDNQETLLVDVYKVGEPEKPYTATFKIAAAAGKKVTVLHWNGSAWDVDGTADADKDGVFKYSFKTEDLSPVTFVFEKTAEAGTKDDSSKASDNGSKAAAADGSKSDKTGEPAVMAVVALVAMLSVAGMVVSAKKEN